MRTYREIAIEPPLEATEFSVPEGMRGWKNKKNGFTVLAIHYSADPEKRSDQWYSEACQNLRDDQIERELEINFDSKAGAKAFPYLEHNEDLYRIDPPNPIPANWKIVVGLDYGGTNPTSVHWYAIDEYRRFWSFDEYYVPMNKVKGGYPEFAKYLKTHPYYSRVRKIVADPSIFNKNQNVLVTKETNQKAHGTIMSVAELLMKEGIYKLQRGNNDRIAGLNRIHTMFNYRGDGLTKPYLFIGTKCRKQWWELCNIVYKPDDNENKNPDEDVVKRNDHAFDETKYALLSEDIPAEVVHSQKAGGTTLKEIEDEIDEKYNKENNDIYVCSFDELDASF